MPKAILNRSFPDKAALITTQGEITYRQLFQRIQLYAELFENKSYKKAAIYAENSQAWIFAFYAALQNNCIVIPIDFLSSAEDVAYIISDDEKATFKALANEEERENFVEQFHECGPALAIGAFVVANRG